MQLAELNREPVEEPFQARADELGEKLTDRLSAGQEMLTGRSRTRSPPITRS